MMIPLEDFTDEDADEDDEGEDEDRPCSPQCRTFFPSISSSYL